MVKTTRTNVSHRKREAFRDGCGLVTVRLKRGLPSLRAKKPRARILAALRAFQDRFECRIVEFAILSNHMHLVVEAKDERELAKAMKGFLVRVARALNKLWNRIGSVFADRYHVRLVQKTMYQVRKVIRYVLQNARKHGIPLPPEQPDPYSSGLWLTTWARHHGKTFSDEPCPVQEARDMVVCLARRLTYDLNELPYVGPPLPKPGDARKRRRLYTLR
jgi:REP element-mobilizing transposase RayT